MRRNTLTISIALFSAALASCIESADSSVLTAEAADPIQGKAGTYTVTLEDWVDVLNTTPAQLQLNGSSSRDLTAVIPWIPDDPWGEGNFSGRQFSITLVYDYEVERVLSGRPLYVELNTATGTPNEFSSRLIVHPGFYNRHGSTAMSLIQTATPIHVRDPINPLRFRAAIDMNQPASSVDLILPDSTRIPGVLQTNGQHTFDLTFDQLHPALGQTITIEAVGNTRNYLKYGVLRGKVQEVLVTSDDPWDVWPEPTCDSAVRVCLEQRPAELASCGSYFQVHACGEIDPCLLDESNFALVEVPNTELADAEAAYDAGSGNGTGFYWTDVDATAYDVQGCDVTLEQIVTNLLPYEQGLEFQYGTVTDRAGIQGHLFFGTGYSSGGPQLWDAAESYGGWQAIEAWEFVAPEQCHNCTQFDDRVVLYYPATSRLVVLFGGHGYDS